MRILHVVVCLDIGGLERVVTDLALAQLRQGHQVRFFSLHPTGGFRPELEAAGIAVEQGAKKGGLDLDTIRAIRRQVQAHDIDVVHTHSFMPNYYAAAALVGIGRRVALVGTVHDMGTRLSNRQLRWLYRASIVRTDRVAMVGSQVHDRFVGQGWVPARKAVTVLNGIPLERFRPTPERRRAARQALGYSDQTLLIGAVGRLVHEKNHHALLAVMPGLLQRWPQLQAVVIGGGALAEDLAQDVRRRGLQDAVRLTGPMQGISDLLPAFDVFAMPSRTEGLSIALLEACATGLPIVATSVGGNPEIIRDGETGLLLPSEDLPALEAALARMLGDEALRVCCGQAAQRWVADHASIEAVGRSYDDLYAAALAPR